MCPLAPSTNRLSPLKSCVVRYEVFHGTNSADRRVGASAVVRGLLERYMAGGATVVFSSHVMDLVQRLCDRVGIMHLGRLIAEGPTDQVRAGRSLEDAFVELVGASHAGAEELGWLGTWSA